LLSLLPAAVLLGACAGTPDSAQSPLVTLDSIEPVAQTEQVILQLNLRNRTDAVMPVTGLRYRVELGGVEFAWGTSRQSVDIPAHGEAVFDLTVPGRLPDAEPGQMRLRYGLGGMIYLAGDRGELPFAHDGVLNWQGVAGP
jgi:hypothetical protein